VIDNLVGLLPTHELECHWPELASLNLADPFFYRPRQVEMLLGSDVLPLLIRPQTLLPTSKLPGAISSTLGWVLYGVYAEPRKPRKTVTFAPDTLETTSKRRKRVRPVDEPVAKSPSADVRSVESRVAEY